MLSLLCALATASTVLAHENATCAASHECTPKSTIMTISPVYTSSVSFLDEAIVGGAFRSTDSPSMRSASFPTYSLPNEPSNSFSVISGEIFDGSLSVDSQSELGMF